MPSATDEKWVEVRLEEPACAIGAGSFPRRFPKDVAWALIAKSARL